MYRKYYTLGDITMSSFPYICLIDSPIFTYAFYRFAPSPENNQLNTSLCIWDRNHLVGFYTDLNYMCF